MVFSFIINLLWQITTINHAKLNLEMKKGPTQNKSNKQTNQNRNKKKTAVFHLSNWLSVAEKHKDNVNENKM